MAIYCVDCGLIALVDGHCRCAACGAKVTRDRLMKDLLETAEEMVAYLRFPARDDLAKWRSVIAAARKELEEM